LRDLGVREFYGDTFPASLDVGRDALLWLGFDEQAGGRAVALFWRHDAAQLDAQYAVHHDEAQLVQTAQEAADQLRDLFETDAVQNDPGAPAGGTGVALTSDPETAREAAQHDRHRKDRGHLR
jgi:hypothetical protein